MTEEIKEESQTIEIGCPPGYPRPGDLLPDVVEGTGLGVRESCSRLFGDWTFDYSDVPKEIWDKANPIIEKRLRDLYNKGIARYVGW